ncbi:hypothetical protein H5410_028211 [Solanum commersonii]|uniref:Uncharacterized protein n=1 Tax=Solanum commersonii TaxID=4109 RepID=A0A9J5Z4A4_SOLCO|nr:hypothetical protein H5410_028211 [Solanum commersonii]
MDTDNPLKTQRYIEVILVNTKSIIIEHTMSDKNPEYISYSRFTIKRILSPSEWYADHLLTPIALSMPHKPQTYNWHDYKNAWFNFLQSSPYGSTNGGAILEEIEIYFPNNFSIGLKNFRPRKKYLHYENTLKCANTLLRKEFLIFYLGTLLRQRWTPKVLSKTPAKVSPRVASTSPSKKVLKERLRKALKEKDDDQSSEKDIMLLLEEVTYDDNGDMLDPTGIAAAYLDSY